MVLHTFFDPKTQTWCGHAVQQIYNPNVNVATVLFNALQRNPNHIGQINDNSGIKLTNQQIRLNGIRLAMNLKRGRLAVSPNEVIALVSRNHELVSAVVLAALALGAPLNTLDADFKAGLILFLKHLKHILTKEIFVYRHS